jgi:hypothetical protein
MIHVKCDQSTGDSCFRRHLTSALMYPEVCVLPILSGTWPLLWCIQRSVFYPFPYLYFLTGLMGLMAVRYACHSIYPQRNKSDSGFSDWTWTFLHCMSMTPVLKTTLCLICKIYLAHFSKAMIIPENRHTHTSKNSIRFEEYILKVSWMFMV